MKAAVLDKSLPLSDTSLRIEEVEAPLLKDNDVLINIRACGICRTDIHIIEGELSTVKFPLIPGHQIVGTVEKMGMSAKKYPVGTRVGVSWLNHTCGECKYCRTGFENLCDYALFTGYTANGGFAEYICVSEDFVFPIPEKLSNEEAAPLLCAGAVGYRALKLSGVKKGETLGLVGFGASAHLVIQVARFLGIDVFVFTRSSQHQEFAKELGASWAGTLEQSPPHYVDSAIIFAPSGETVVKTLPYLEKNGRILMSAIHATPIPEIQYRDLWNEKSIKSVANVTREDIKELLNLASQIPIKPTLVTFHLSEVNTALLKQKRGEILGEGVILFK